MATVVEQVKMMMDSAFQTQEWGNKLLHAQGVDSRMLSDVAPIDDGVEPFMPENVHTTPFLGAVSVQWDTPRRYDYVVKAIIEYTALAGETAGEIQEVEVRSGNGHVLYGLDYVEYSFRVKFLDMWDYESAWSMPVTGRPNETADYKIDLEKARQLGNVSSLMSLVNDALIAGENFAAGTVRQIALAQPEHPNQLPLIEVDFDQWDAEMSWPPTDTNILGETYIQAVIPNGITAKVADFAGRRWLEVNRTTATLPDPSVYPFANWKRRETQPNTYYIASVYVQGPAGKQVRLGVQASKNVEGTDLLSLAQTNSITLDGSPQGTRIAVKFFMGAEYPYIRFRIDTMNENTITRWTRFQLEEADETKTEPGAWTPGVMSVGIVNSRLLTAIDANIANALFKNAAIESAAIKNLTADKIDAGILNAGTINVASLLEMHQGTIDASGNTTLPPGLIKAGNTWLDANGLSLLAQDTYDTPATFRSSALTGRNQDGSPMSSAIAFYDDTRVGQKYRGIVARADGDALNDGLIALHSTNDGLLGSQTSARLEVRASKAGAPGVVFVYKRLSVSENAYANDFVSKNRSLEGHKHDVDWGDVDNKPSFGDFVKDGGSVSKLNVQNLSVGGHAVRISKGYLMV